jgi:DnaA family protein
MNGLLYRGAQLSFDFHRNQSAGFTSFYPGANAEVLAALQSLAVNPRAQAVYLWGGQATGKTHLLQALCHASAAHRRVVFLPLRDAVGHGSSICEGLEYLDLVCIDDVDTVAGDAGWEQALFALFNALRDTNGILAVSSRTAPRECTVQLADLRSRLAWGLVYQLKPLSDNDKRGLLIARAQQQGFHLSSEVVDFILHRCPRDIASLCAVFDRINAASLSAQRHVTIPFVRELLEAD